MIKILSDEKFGIFNVAAYYRPQWVKIDDLLDSMGGFMDEFGENYCFIGGDMNIDFLCDSDVRLRYSDLLNSLGFSVSNDKRTRCRSGTLLDHAITNFPGNDTIDNDFSDHSIVLTEVRIPKREESEGCQQGIYEF